MHDRGALTKVPPLVTKYSLPKSKLHCFRNGFMFLYLTIAYAAPLSGLIGMLVWLLTPGGQTGSSLNFIAIPVTILFAMTMMVVYLWIVLTPFALIAFISSRRWLGLAPLLMYVLGIGCSFVLTNINQQIPLFAVIFLLAVKFQRQVMREIKAEPARIQPKVVGCNSALHLEAEPIEKRDR